MPMQDGTGPRETGRGQGQGQGQGRGRGPCGGKRAHRHGTGGGRWAAAASSPLSEQIAQLRVQINQLESAAFAEAAR